MSQIEKVLHQIAMQLFRIANSLEVIEQFYSKDDGDKPLN